MIKQIHFNTILHFTFTLNGQAASVCLQPSATPGLIFHICAAVLL